VDFWRIVVAVLLPPLGVFLQVGIGKQFWINILLTILGYIPGIWGYAQFPRRHALGFSVNGGNPPLFQSLRQTHNEGLEQQAR
jgi:uncharacterized membrane protein YqaE (UPF0057 family)